MSNDDRQILMDMQREISQLCGRVDQFMENTTIVRTTCGKDKAELFTRMNSLEQSRATLTGWMMGAGIVGGTIGQLVMKHLPL